MIFFLQCLVVVIYTMIIGRTDAVVFMVVFVLLVTRVAIRAITVAVRVVLRLFQ